MAIADIEHHELWRPASLSALIDHLDTAVPRYSMAGINGHEDLETASTLLGEALHADDEAARAQRLDAAPPEHERVGEIDMARRDLQHF